MEINLQLIDSLLKPEHYYLKDDDKCYFLGEYTPGEGYDYSGMNSFIYNFKKSPEKKEHWRYKEKVIKDISNILISLRVWKKIKNYTWIPMPPSKAMGHPLHDDRLLQVLKILKSKENAFDYRELVKIISTREPAHNIKKDRPRPKEHYQNYKIDTDLIEPHPSKIIIFDDIVTTGSSFKAMQQILKETYPNADIFGLFIARSVHC